MASEHPELECARVDLDPAGAPDAAALALLRELARDPGEPQVALRGETRYTPSLDHARSPAPVEDQPRRIDITERGLLDNLVSLPLERRAPGPGEVEVRVLAAGLNFRDVLKALDLYPGDGGPFGDECVGEVVRVGPGVTTLRAGDTVMGMATGSFASFVTTKADLMIAVPEGLNVEEAATVPITFLTAYYALHELAGLRAGEKVLIHAAAGGVGLAAVQLARRAGAEIFATAGSDEKRAFLASLGVRHIFDSRSLDFAEEIMRLTGGRGVDVVLNSLAGEFIPKSLSTLARDGRFLEIGRRDVWDAAQMAAARPDVRYSLIYLGDLSEGRPPAIQAMLQALAQGFTAGELAPLPRTVFPFGDAVGAFRYMAQARHIGKVVLVQPAPRQSAGMAIRPDGTYLITGGLGGIGRAVARWLAGRGARHLVLSGRTVTGAAADEALRELEEIGVSVRLVRADVSRADDVARLLAEIGATMPPLRGVIHAAGVVDDGVLAQQEWGRFTRVLAPKVAGAWHLHRQTRALPLDLFVLFSSAAALIGSPGQSSYAAANAFLDALAHRRRAEGLPALSISWGPWDNTGMTARLGRQDQSRWARQGLAPMAPGDALAALEQALRRDLPHVAIMARDAAPARPGDDSLAETRPGAPAPFLQQWNGAAPSLRRGLLLGFIRSEAIRILGLPPTQAIPPRTPLQEFGLDSLMAVELRNALAASLGHALPATLLFDYPTIDALADYLVKSVPALASEDAVQTGANGTAAGEDVDAELWEMSDEAAEALLLAELEEMKRGR